MSVQVQRFRGAKSTIMRGASMAAFAPPGGRGVKVAGATATCRHVWEVPEEPRGKENRLYCPQCKATVRIRVVDGTKTRCDSCKCILRFNNTDGRCAPCVAKLGEP